MSKLPETICTPCVDVTPTKGDASFLDENGKLPAELCCEPEVKEPIAPFSQRIQRTTINCYSSMLKNMTSAKFCGVGPKACG